MTFKLAILVGAAAAALVASLGPSSPTASATPVKFVRCMETPLSVSAVGHGMWGTNQRITFNAINNWQAAASEHIGTNYANWANALGASVECHRLFFKVTCVAIATPCRS